MLHCTGYCTLYMYIYMDLNIFQHLKHFVNVSCGFSQQWIQEMF